MQDRSLSPLAGPPHTVESVDGDSNPVIAVYLSAVGPFTAKWSDRIGIVAGVGSALAATAAAFATHAFGVEQAAMIVGAGPTGWAVSRHALRQVFRSRASVVFTPDKIAVRRAFRQTRIFNRNVTHSFARIQHDKREVEARRILWLEATFGKKWFNFSYRTYCGYSEHVALMYLNQRHDVITICHDRQPEQVHARLLAATDIMDGYANRGGGQAMRPSDDWTAPSDRVVESF